MGRTLPYHLYRQPTGVWNTSKLLSCTHCKEFPVINRSQFIHRVKPLLRKIISSHKEAREPRFPMKICDRTFKLAKSHLAALDYHGPVALACDDTKLFAVLRLFWDKEEGSYFLVGACGGPIRVLDVDAAQGVLMDPKVKKATKVRHVQFVYRSDNDANYLDPLVVHDDTGGWGCASPPRRSPDLRQRESSDPSATPQQGPLWSDQGEDPSRFLLL